ncbi:T9SS type A sorting domain-containing protein [Aureisphaera galaxeae]|uniref:T9SS type A sorting domain-containing protein n=1 Tax=Aureisphaera galaxeae TaxID=1538023 RepID=UPI002350938B|nr:T9SS type A sorting domain-containing protein [Aureisphaera galaxeae]MDC8003947.1 T9SS type A sorting domain-containing protein [Aureisphaera galaxeae]
MKKKLLMVTFLALSTSLWSQDYIPMLDEENTWSVDIYYSIFEPLPPNPCCFTITDQLTVGGTVTHNGMDYTQLYIDGAVRCDLREENGIVYKYDENEEADKVLIDMNLEVGEVFNLLGSAYDVSFPICHTAGNGMTYTSMTVETVEYLDIAGETRKVITFSNYSQPSFTQIKWIEGIGNIHGFDGFWELLDITAGQALVCFTNSSGTYYFNEATSCDNTTLGIDDFSEEAIVLYPNPVTSKSILQFPEGAVDRIQIYNVSGKLVTEIRPSSNHFVLDMMQYSAGLYFYQVFSEKKLLKTAQFIIR